MPSLLDPTGGQGDPLGIETGLGSALSSGAAQPGDTGAAIASFLAAASAMANAGAPTLGPPPTTAQAILGSLSAGRGAAIQNQVLPYVVQHAAIQQQQELLNYEQQLWQFNRQRAYDNFVKGGAAAVLPSAAAPAPAAGPGAATAGAGPSGDIAQLPDVMALPDQTRLAAVQAMTNAGMSPAEASQYARMLIAESGGLHVDAKGKVITSPKGASGVAQVMPQTFLDMAQAHPDVTGSVSDLVPNLTAGAHYFHDQVTANGGDLRNGAIGYNLGPTGLADFLAGRRVLPAETTDYLTRTRAPAAPGSVLVADSSGRTVPQPGAPGAADGPVAGATDPLVQDPLTGAMVPRSVELAAQGVGRGSATPMEAHAAVIKDYLEKKALMPTFRPGTAPGQQVSSQGEVSAATPGTVTLSAPTPDQRKSMFPNLPAWQDVLLKRDPAGNIVGYELPSMGEEPIKPISDAQAQKPADEGGAGASYRTGTSYGVGTRSGLVKPIQIERGAGPPLPGDTGATVMTPGQQQALDFLSSQAQRDQRITNFQLQLGYVGRIANVAADPTRTATDDIAALAAFEKFNNPTAAVTQEGENAVLTTGGPEQRIQTVISKLSGGRFLTPDVVQNIINTLNTESEGARAGFTVASNNLRRQAKTRGVDPDLVTPDPDQMVREYQAEWKAAQDRLRSGQGVGGQTAVPGAAPTPRAGTAPPEPSPPPQQMPVPSQANLQGMSNAGLKAVVADMQVHPERYSDAYRAAIGAEMAKPTRQRSGGGG